MHFPGSQRGNLVKTHSLYGKAALCV